MITAEGTNPRTLSGVSWSSSVNTFLGKLVINLKGVEA